MLKKWVVLLCWGVLLLLLGCAEVEWITKQMEEYEKKQKQATQAKQGVESGPVYSEKLEKLPEGVQLPPSLTDKISYDAEKQLLIYRGAMKEEDKDALLKLSQEPAYQEAVKRLYVSSLPTGGGKAVEIQVVDIPAHTVEGKVSPPEKPTGPQVVLKEGSVIKGSIKGEIPFQTELGTFKIRGEDILSYLEGSLRLKDGTILQGKILQESLLIQTDYGELEVKTESIANITSE